MALYLLIFNFLIPLLGGLAFLSSLPYNAMDVFNRPEHRVYPAAQAMSDEAKKSPTPRPIRRLAVVAVPLLALGFMLFVDLDPQHPEITRTAAVALWMAVWWITEAIPLAATALLPLVLFPFLGIMDGREVSSQYINHIIFIFVGGFMVALTMERWQLHRRLALRMLTFFGIRPRFTLLGFMLATALLSMWISNTATAMMMVPIALAIVTHLEEMVGRTKIRKFSTGIFLGIAYGASIGGVATLIGTPPNLSFVRILHIFFPGAPDISFARWFLFAFPVSLCFLILVWLILARRFCPGTGIDLDRDTFKKQHAALGPITFEEKIVLADFVLLVLLWMTRVDIVIGNLKVPGWSTLLPQSTFVNDGTVAVLMALVLFLVPARNAPGKRVLNWATAARIPWNIVLLFGGGFALASGFKSSGLSRWLGGRLEGLSGLPPILIVAVVCLVITFLTELTSNTATAEILLPVLAALAVSIRINPLFLMVPGTLSCSFAFMLPVATPPNAIVFGTRRLRIPDMARIGVWINLLGVVMVTAALLFLGRAVLGIDLAALPAWATLD